MNYYLIYGKDVEHSLERRRSVRPAHLQRLEALKAAGKLLVAGPLLHEDHDPNASHGFSGSVIIASFNTLDEAKAWAAADPYVTAGVYSQVIIQPFKQVF